LTTRLKRPGRDADHSRPCTAEVKKAYIYMSVQLSVRKQCVALSVARGRYSHFDARIQIMIPTQDSLRTLRVFKLCRAKITNCKSFFLDSFPVEKLSAYVKGIFVIKLTSKFFFYVAFLLKFAVISKEAKMRMCFIPSPFNVFHASRPK
jgi:hypothetical protein